MINMETETRKPIDIMEFERLNEEIHPLKIVFDQMPDHVIITDANANIVYANKAAERHTGFSQKEILGRNPGDFWGGKMPKSFYEKMWYRIKVEKEPFFGEVFNQEKDGTGHWQELRITPVLDEKSEVKFFIGIEPNITNRKIREEEREKFISVFERRTQNSFAAMRQTLDWLSVNGKLNHKQNEKLEAIYKQHQNLSAMINDLISFVV